MQNDLSTHIKSLELGSSIYCATSDRAISMKGFITIKMAIRHTLFLFLFLFLKLKHQLFDVLRVPHQKSI